jgi:hypothetical protein
MLKTSRIKHSRPLSIFTPFVLSAFATTACSFNISTATLENPKMCSEVAEGQQCVNDTTTFEKNASQIFVASGLKFAPSGTKLKIK